VTRASRRPIALAVLAALVSVLVFFVLAGSPVLAQPGGGRGPLRAQLTGFEEVPAILSPARGSFEARPSQDGAALEFRLRYGGFLTPVAMAHIHIGQPGVNGSIAIFLCGGAEPACPAMAGEVEGTIVAADVLAIPAQGLAAGDLAAVLRAIRAGVAYVNVHSGAHPGGEIRGQIGRGGPPHGGPPN
jgi:hypothetical protein